MSNIWQLWIFLSIFNLQKCGSQDCPTVFTRVPSNVISRGAVSTHDTTQAECEQSCRNINTCKSYQLDTNTGHALCWIQLSNNQFTSSNLYIDSNITEFIKNTSCHGCVAQFTRVPGNVISRRAVSTQDTTQAACEQSCRNNINCKSYQLDTNTGHHLCWIQLSDNPFTPDNLYIDPNINEFTKNLSCTNCFVDFNSVTNYATGGATAYSNITNSQDCRALCIALSTCLSYQIDSSGVGALCWIQTASNPKFLNNGVTEYTKFTNCTNPSFI